MPGDRDLPTTQADWAHQVKCEACGALPMHDCKGLSGLPGSMKFHPVRRRMGRQFHAQIIREREAQKT